MEEFIGCDAHKKFSVFVTVNERGNAGGAQRVPHERQLVREFLALATFRAFNVLIPRSGIARQHENNRRTRNGAAQSRLLRRPTQYFLRGASARRNSCGGSFCMYCRTASCGFASSDSLPTEAARKWSRFAGDCCRCSRRSPQLPSRWPILGHQRFGNALVAPEPW
jgi:hypothetical protein